MYWILPLWIAWRCRRSVVRIAVVLSLWWNCPPRRQQPSAAPRFSSLRTMVAAGDGPAVAPARRKPDWVVREVLRLAVVLRSCRPVADTFNAIHGHRDTVSKSYVHQLCRARASELQARRRGMRGQLPAAVPVGHAFSLDLSTMDGGQMVLCLLDQGSRAVLRLKVLAHKCAWTLLSELCAAIAEHGLPAGVRTDNEGMFTGRAWRMALRCFGIRQQRTDVRSPWQNGRVERLFGTIKPWLARMSLPSPSRLQGALDECALFYNYVRLHQALGGLTPAQAWRGLTPADVRRCTGRGQWVQAFDGRLVGYCLRC